MKNPAPVSAPPQPIGLRLLRVAALLGLAVGITFVADLCLLVLCPQSEEFILRVVGGRMPITTAAVAPVVTMIGLSILAFCYAGGLLRTRTPRRLVYAGLLVISVLVADLVLMAFALPDSTAALIDLLSDNRLGDLGFIVCLGGLVPAVTLAVVWRLHAWRWIAGGYLVLGLFLAYLATDDPAVISPVTFEQISPVFPGAEASFDVLMRYGRQHPLGQAFKSPNRIFAGNDRFVDASKPTEWPAWLVRHRAAIEADWVELAPIQAWIGELDGFERIGDLTPARFDAEVITFAPIRSYTQHVCAIAGLQAIEGQGDEAIATLLPLLQVSRKLGPSARSLVRTMIAQQMQDTAMATTNFVLDTTQVSLAMRNRLAVVMAGGLGGESGVRHLLAIESVCFVEESAGKALGDLMFFQTRQDTLRRCLKVTGRFLYNPRRTTNLYGEFVVNLQNLAARREKVTLDGAQQAWFDHQLRPGFKNFMGTLLLRAIIPHYPSLAYRYWKTEDARTALLARLTNS